MFLGELNTPVTALKGIGESRGQQLACIGIHTMSDLLLHFPRTYEDRKTIVPLSKGIGGTPVNTIVTVTGQNWFRMGRKQVLKVAVEDETATASLVCYGRNFLERMLVPGKKFRLYARFQEKFSELQTGAFTIEAYDDADKENRPSKEFGRLLPVYPLTGDITQKQLRNAVAQALKEGGSYIEDETTANVMKEFGIASKAQALTAIHFPGSEDEAQKAREYLAYEELLYLHLNLQRRNRELKDSAGTKEEYITEKSEERLTGRVYDSLPFSLTPDQTAVLDEITRDIRSRQPMARLLQGDVGSGKTLVAFLSACTAISAGRQVAFMAPTELLARQHGENAVKYLAPSGIRISLLTGSINRENRKLLLESLRTGQTDLVIGTHALFSRDVEYKNLGLVIVDEQHRFGVGQRLALTQKAVEGSAVDFLLMTATPIPRTLAQTLFSDLDVSTITTMPPGRKPVHTHLARMGNEEKVYAWVAGILEKGQQAYFVYPLIEESSGTELKNATQMHDTLSRRYAGYRTGIIHSRLGEEEKLQTMRDFAQGRIQILAATSVVEVGVDVPNATCMVIEHAERFGLSALHQLRGRVGRGTAESYCFLIYGNELTPEGTARLKVMKDTTDGFKIAEEDLLIRGPGDLTGKQQSGYLNLRIADLLGDRDLSDRAKETAASILNDDPGLLKPLHRVYRSVLTRANPFDPGVVSGV